MKQKLLFLAVMLIFSIHSFSQQFDLSLITYRQGDKWDMQAPIIRWLLYPGMQKQAGFLKAMQQ
jgi:hypothetical protein